MALPSAEELRRLAHLEELARAAGAPVFGHMRLDTGLRRVDVLLGAATRVEGPATVIDWRNAPLAEVFFAYDEGDRYEVEVEGRAVTGRLLEKSLLGFTGGELTRVEQGGRALVRDADGSWSSWPARAPALEPRPKQARQPFRSPLEVRLDLAQQRAVDLPASRSVLLLGEAGFGKTTVALHRLVALEQRASRAWRGAVIVPTEGLRRLSEMMLLRRGETRVEVFTFDRWARQLARRSFRGLPRRESRNTAVAVMRLKRHSALRPVLAAFARAHRKSSTGRADLELLFGDRAWMERVVAGSGGALPRPLVEELAQHTKLQFLESAETEYAHVDRARLETLDGGRLDEGTPQEDANSIDAEDYAVLFELERLRAEAAGRPPSRLSKYDCVVVDEAQELAPIELALIRRSLRPHGTVIVAGDAAQQVDPSSCFGGWDEVLTELGAPDAERVTLEVSYRCPAEVTQLARSILQGGRGAAAVERSITRAGHGDPFHLCVWLCEQLARVQAEDPSASVAVICRSREAARSFAHALRHGPRVALALDGELELRPGVTVTCVEEVKGLEFDYVVVPDAAPSTYPDTAESRRALYVAVTRATHRLALAGVGRPSPLVSLSRADALEESASPG